MAVFESAEIDQEGGGNIILSPGRYFVDTETEDILAVLKQEDGLSSVIPKSSFVDFVGSSGRGQAMLEFDIQEPAVIPNSIARATGFWFRLPEGMSLLEAHDKLYPEFMREPRSFLEWLQAEHPETFQAAFETAKVVDKTARAAGKAAANTGFTFLETAAKAAAFLAVGLVALKLIRRPSHS